LTEKKTQLREVTRT